MNKNHLKIKVLSYPWEATLERPLSVFTLSLFKGDTLKKYYLHAGLSAHYRGLVYQNQSWYQSPKISNKFEGELRKYLKNGGTVKKISSSCTKLYKTNKPLILKLTKSKKRPLEKLREYYLLFSPTIVYIWITLGLEPIINAKLEKIALEYYGDKTKDTIPNLIKPVKKTAYEKMENDLKNSLPLGLVAKKWGWIKDRDGFGDPFTIEELKRQKENLIKNSLNILKNIKIPRTLQKIVSEARELTFLRTHRTDNIHELLFLGRQIFKEAADYFNISFSELRDYSAHDLIKNKPIKYKSDATRISYNGQMEFYKPSLIKTNLSVSNIIKGTTAFPGIIRGTVKIVKTPNELKKVRAGDVLVAQMTFPSFIIAMRQASAFVTDEGGITCHAAIISREMKKPCIIGTKIATKVLRDGDLVEVDANKGVVKILKKAETKKSK